MMVRYSDEAAADSPPRPAPPCCAIGAARSGSGNGQGGRERVSSAEGDVSSPPVPRPQPRTTGPRSFLPPRVPRAPPRQCALRPSVHHPPVEVDISEHVRCDGEVPPAVCSSACAGCSRQARVISAKQVAGGRQAVVVLFASCEGQRAVKKAVCAAAPPPR